MKGDPRAGKENIVLHTEFSAEADETIYGKWLNKDRQ